MPQKSETIAKIFLNELNSSKNQSMFESLNYLLEILEEKEDPEPKELRIVDLAYQTIEKLKLLETLLKTYAKAGDKTDGSKLQSLYEKIPTGTGTSIMFD